jgi:hypothetical protein
MLYKEAYRRLKGGEDGNGELEITTPLGSGRARGNQLIIIFLMIAFGAAVTALNWRDHAAMLQEMKAQTYILSILSLPQDKRPRVLVQPPEEFRPKVIPQN